MFPLRVRVWSQGRKPDLLNVIGNPKAEHTDAATDATGDDRERSWPTKRKLPEDQRPIVQEGRWRRGYGAKARGRRGCITQLQNALGALPEDAWSNLMKATGLRTRTRPMRKGAWTMQALNLAMQASVQPGVGDPQSVVRQLKRLNAGTYRVDAFLVVRVARTFGVALDDLVFLHEVPPRHLLKGNANPVAQLNACRHVQSMRALRKYDVALEPLGGHDTLAKLATDILDPYTRKDLVQRWQPEEALSPADSELPALRTLNALLTGGDGPQERLAEYLRASISAVEQMGLCLRVGRYISVAEAPYPVRRVHVVVAHAPGDICTQVNLLPSSRNRPTIREEVLADGDLSVVPGILNDIAWCGHWEGRWLPFSPLDAPDWIRQAVEQQAKACAEQVTPAP